MASARQVTRYLRNAITRNMPPELAAVRWDEGHLLFLEMKGDDGQVFVVTTHDTRGDEWSTRELIRVETFRLALEENQQLREACEEMYEVLRLQCHGIQNTQNSAMAMERARAAIKKARGEE